MPERTEYPPGMPCWVDIGTDVEGAKKFYGSLFGWETQDAGPPEETGGYGFFLKNGKQVAGYGPQQNPGPPFWSSYVSVTDADETAKKVESASGSVVMAPMDVMAAGRMAIFQDPTGAFISVWQPGEHKGAQLVTEDGAYCWNELNTRDVEKAKAFYAAVFGWGSVTHEGEMPYTEFQLGSETVAGMMPMSPQVPAAVPPHWLVYFGADDIDSTQTKAEGLGASVMVGAMSIPDGGRFAVLTDPQGAAFGIFRGAG
jgi:predicted enzyme related to lactoylglutathione lyase